MEPINLVLFAITAVLVVLYVARRRNRLKNEN